MRHPRIYLFYAGLLAEELSFFPTLDYMGREMYDGSYLLVFDAKKVRPWMDDGWYRADKTPCLIQDVPKELRTLSLLLT